MIRRGVARAVATASLAACLLNLTGSAHAAFTASVFARGADVSGSRPDSITTDGTHVFIQYGNGASSSLPLGTGGASTIAEYDMSGKVLNTFSVLGSADGVRFNAATNQLWVLQNQDANSALTTIDVGTGMMNHYTYSLNSPTRGYDDVNFAGGNAYVVNTNPNSGSDTIIHQATLGNGVVNLSSVLTLNATGTNTATGQTGPIPASDPDSLNLRPDGSLLLTSGNDASLTTIRNPGTGTQSVSFVSLITAAGTKLTELDDTVFASRADQRLLVADTANNIVYALTGTFQAGGAYSSVSNFVASVDLTTGVSTSITDGLFAANASPHGLAFIPAAAVPEPSTLILSTISALAGLGCYGVRRRKGAR